MKIGAFGFLFASMINIFSANTTTTENIADINIIKTSQQLLLQAKTNEPTDLFVEILKNVPQKLLTPQLKIIIKKNFKAFWINLYNAYTQLILSKNSIKNKNRNSFLLQDKSVLPGSN